MEVMVAVQSGTLLRALRVRLKRRVSARTGGDYNEVPQATQKKSRPSPSNCVTTLIFGSYLVLVDPFQEYEIGEKEKEEEGKKRERKRKEKGKKKEKEGKEEGGKDKLRLGRIHGKRGRF